jgi:hypothetical protein
MMTWIQLELSNTDHGETSTTEQVVTVPVIEGGLVGAMGVRETKQRVSDDM